MKNILKFVFVISVMSPSLAFACFPNTGPIIGFSGAALQQMSLIKTSFASVVVTPVKQSIDIAFSNVQNAIVQRDMMIVKAVSESSSLAFLNSAESSNLLAKLRGTHKLALERDTKLASLAIYSGDASNVGDKDRYFRSMCADNKAKKQIFGTGGYIQKKESTNDMLSKVDAEASKVKDSRVVNRESQLKHYSKYCSEQGVLDGLCDEVSIIPHGDVLSAVALEPQNNEGMGMVDDIGYFTRSTYSDFEREASGDFYDNVARVGLLRQPTPVEIKSNPFIYSRYSQLQAALSLARLTFKESKSNRVAVLETAELRLSRFDRVGYLLEKTKQESVGPGSSSTTAGKQFSLIAQKALSNYLAFEKSLYRERINILMATLVAVKESSPSRIKAMESER